MYFLTILPNHASKIIFLSTEVLKSMLTVLAAVRLIVRQLSRKLAEKFTDYLSKN